MADQGLGGQSSNGQNLTTAKRERAKAQENLRDSIKTLETIQQGLAKSRAEVRQVRHRLSGSETSLKKLKRQIQKTQRKEKNLTGKEDGKSQERLKQIQKELAESRAETERVRGTIDENKTELERREEQIREKQEEANEVGKRLRAAIHDLNDKKRNVVRAAVDVNVGALRTQLREVIDTILKFGKWLGSLGATVYGGIYAYAVVLGAVSEYKFYSRHGLNILNYASSSDFLLSGYKLIVIPLFSTIFVIILLAVFYVIVAILLRLRIPIYAEYLAGVLPDLVSRDTRVKSILVVSILLLLPLIGAAASGPILDSKKEDRVSIVTIRPLQQADTSQQATTSQQDGASQQANTFIRIGSTSAFLFLKGLKAKEDDPALAIPLSQIVCMSEMSKKDENSSENGADGKGCKPVMTDFERAMSTRVESIEKKIEENTRPRDVVVKKEHNNWIVELLAAHSHGSSDGPIVYERPLRKHIAQKIGCNEEKISRSDFIRFDYSKADRVDDAGKEKVKRFVNERKEKGEIKKWFVFGFASPDGNSSRNRVLARQRADTVRTEICPLIGGESDCENVIVENSGEAHPINGTANARSVVIAVCDG